MGRATFTEVFGKAVLNVISRLRQESGEIIEFAMGSTCSSGWICWAIRRLFWDTFLGL